MAEEEIRESERKYRELYETIKDGILATDLEGNILEFNKAFLSILEYSAAEIRNKNVLDITPEKRHKLTVEIANQVKARGYSDEYEIGFTKRDGTVSHISVRGWLKKDREGNPAGMWAIVRDITEHKRAEEALMESEERYRRLLEYSGSAMVVIEKDKTVSFVNKEFQKLSGYSKKEIIGRNFLDFIPEKYKKRMARYHEDRRKTKEKVPITYEFEAFDKKGRKKIIEVTVAMVPGTDRTTAALRDITEVKKLEKELKQMMKELRS